MTESTVICREDRRRRDVRAQGRNGIDAVEVGEPDPRVLTVFLFEPPPDSLEPANVRVDGGRRVRNLKVVSLRLPDSAEENDFVQVTLDREGDFSPYTLRLVQSETDDAPPDGFDPRYAQAEFSFRINCPSDLDCRTELVCPPASRTEPEINYLAKDYTTFRQLILDRLALLMPDWHETHIPDLGIALVELLAYVGDYLSYYQDAVATEAYLGTARQRISVRRHARLVDYPMHEGCNARTWVCLQTATDLTVTPQQFFFVTGSRDVWGTDAVALDVTALERVPVSAYESFEPIAPDVPMTLRAAHSEIRFYTWGDAECCLPRGATSATLVDMAPPVVNEGDAAAAPSGAIQLQPGDFLLLEEVRGVTTGDPADADPAHRWVVRLTQVTRDVDPLYEQPVVDVAWAREDALPFPLCLSTLGQAPDCALLTDVSVARGNVLLCDHGRRVGPEDLGLVPADTETPACCDGEGEPADVVPTPGRFRPTLAQGPLTFAQAVPNAVPAAGLLAQDPRRAAPWLRLNDDTPGQLAWTPHRDLIASGPDDADVVAEMDNDGRAHLRFGDGDLGRLPAAGVRFTALYRVGVGPAGNIGADSLTRIVFRADLPNGDALRVFQPLAAQDGLAPEPLAEVKLFAPGAFRARLERAVTAADYAALAQRNSQVRRAAADLRWTGSWAVAQVGLEPWGTDDLSPELRQGVERTLRRYRRLGHDLLVEAAEYVPLDIRLQVCVKADYLRGHVQAALIDLFSNRVLPGGGRGLFHPDSLSFGDPIAVSRLVAAAQAVAGVESVRVVRLRRLFGPPDGEEVPPEWVLTFGPLEVARLDNDPSLPENGRFALEMEGGR